MSNFRVGQSVVCIDDEWEAEGGPPPFAPLCDLPRKNVVYQVRSVSEDGNYIRLREIINAETQDYKEPEFLAEAFRPVVERKIDISVFKKLLCPSPLHEEERTN